MKVEWVPVIVIAKAALPSVLVTGGLLLPGPARRKVLELLAEHVDRMARQAHERIAEELDMLAVTE